MESHEPQAQLLALIERFLAELHPDLRLQGGVVLENSLDRDLGLDSLSRVELFVRIEKGFDIHLPERCWPRQRRLLSCCGRSLPPYPASFQSPP